MNPWLAAQQPSPRIPLWQPMVSLAAGFLGFVMICASISSHAVISLTEVYFALCVTVPVACRRPALLGAVVGGVLSGFGAAVAFLAIVILTGNFTVGGP